MPKRRTHKQAQRQRVIGMRPLWSGTLSFGLVNIPVNLYPANRTERVALHMLSHQGQRLRREYYCPKEDKAISADEIIRGYEISKDEFVLVTDEELEALAPERSRDIDLRRFVTRESLHPLLFERAYFLAPASESTKAYRLLAETLQAKERAGIATFVMRGKEYLVAILAEEGVLRAETLRFIDELRTLEDLDFPAVTKPRTDLVSQFRKTLRESTRKELELSELEDTHAEQVVTLAERKRKAGKDVFAPPEEAESPTEDEEAEVIDLMDVLKRSLQGGDSGKRRGPVGRGPTGKAPSKTTKRSAPNRSELAKLSKQDLYDRAQRLDISGRSQMNKQQLIKAIERAS